jgi:hypothetical protein
MKVLLEDGTDIDDFLKEMDIENNKKNFRNWFNKNFPKGIPGVDFAAYYVLTHPWVILFEWKRQIKWGWQRVSRGYDDRAVWHVGYYLSEILPPIIRQLKKVKHGFPVRMYEGAEDFPISEMELGSIDKDGNYVETEEEKTAAEKWDKILDEIADGFEAYLKFDEEFDYKTPREDDENYKKFQRALDLLKEHYEDLWD